jgi:hypothetical protein
VTSMLGAGLFRGLRVLAVDIGLAVAVYAAGVVMNAGDPVGLPSRLLPPFLADNLLHRYAWSRAFSFAA